MKLIFSVIQGSKTEMDKEKRYLRYLKDVIDNMGKVLFYKDLDFSLLNEQEQWEK